MRSDSHNPGDPPSWKAGIGPAARHFNIPGNKWINQALALDRVELRSRAGRLLKTAMTPTRNGMGWNSAPRRTGCQSGHAFECPLHAAPPGQSRFPPDSAENRFQISCQNSNSAAVGGSTIGLVVRDGSGRMPHGAGSACIMAAGNSGSKNISSLIRPREKRSNRWHCLVPSPAVR